MDKKYKINSLILTFRFNGMYILYKKDVRDRNEYYAKWMGTYADQSIIYEKIDRYGTFISQMQTLQALKACLLVRSTTNGIYRGFFSPFYILFVFFFFNFYSHFCLIYSYKVIHSFACRTRN